MLKLFSFHYFSNLLILFYLSLSFYLFLFFDIFSDFSCEHSITILSIYFHNDIFPNLNNNDFLAV